MNPTLGGGSRSGGVPTGPHPIANLSEQGRKTLDAGYGTPAYPKDAGWLFRGHEASLSRVLEFSLDDNLCMQSRLVPGAHPDENGLDELPAQHKRLIHLSSDIPQVDFVCRTVTDPATGDPKLERQPITLQDFPLLIHSVAVGIKHADLQILKGVKKGLVPILDEQTVLQILDGKIKAPFKFPVTQPKTKKVTSRRRLKKEASPEGSDGKVKEVAVDILVKVSDLCDHWIRNVQNINHKRAPGYAPWLAALGLSYLQSSACDTRLEKLAIANHIERDEKTGWYTLARLPGTTPEDRSFSLKRPSKARMEAHAMLEIPFQMTPPSSGSPSTWKTSPSDGALSSQTTDKSRKILFPPLPSATKFAEVATDKDMCFPLPDIAVPDGLPHDLMAGFGHLVPPTSEADFQSTSAPFVDTWSAAMTAAPGPNLEAPFSPLLPTMGTSWLGSFRSTLCFISVTGQPPEADDPRALDAWFHAACPNAALECARQVRALGQA